MCWRAVLIEPSERFCRGVLGFTARAHTPRFITVPVMKYLSFPSDVLAVTFGAFVGRIAGFVLVRAARTGRLQSNVVVEAFLIHELASIGIEMVLLANGDCPSEDRFVTAVFAFRHWWFCVLCAR